MSECTGPGCTHPEHVDPMTVTALEYQHRPTHAGDAAREAYLQKRVDERRQLLELFAPEKLAVMNRAERRAALRGRL